MLHRLGLVGVDKSLELNTRLRLFGAKLVEALRELRKSTFVLDADHILEHVHPLVQVAGGIEGGRCVWMHLDPSLYVIKHVAFTRLSAWYFFCLERGHLALFWNEGSRLLFIEDFRALSVLNQSY